MIAQDPSCTLCQSPGGELVWQDGQCSVVLPGEADYPALCRVVWHAHVREMTDLTAPERRHLMSVVFAAEAALRQLTDARKMNLASLGNVVPHLHWHVVPRHEEDRNFPNAIWGPENPGANRFRLPAPAIDRLREAIVQSLAEEQGGIA